MGNPYGADTLRRFREDKNLYLIKKQKSTRKQRTEVLLTLGNIYRDQGEHTTENSSFAANLEIQKMSSLSPTNINGALLFLVPKV
jgi:hypothetical protein